MNKPQLYKLVSKGGGDVIAGEIIGTMARFESGACVIEWSNEAWPEHKQLSGTHHSIYGSYRDADTATNAEIREYNYAGD